MPDLGQAYAWALATCNAPNVGYSMDYRNQQTINGITYYDCSSFIWYALLAGGFDCVAANDGDTWPFDTGHMGGVLTRLGFVSVDRTGVIMPGDIGVHNRGSANGHTEMYYTGGNGTGRTMGAHSSGYALADQVSVNTGNTPGTFWEAVYRYPGGINYRWHNKNYGAYSRDSAEAQENVLKILSILLPRGWTANAVAGMLGNIEAESGLNPWRWQGDTPATSGGYGLFQYTPSGNYINSSVAQGLEGYAPNYPIGSGGQDDGTAQLLFMLADVIGDGHQYYSTPEYPLSFAEYQASGESPEYLASAWLKNFERAGVEVEETRRANARYWFEWIGQEGFVPVSTPSKSVLFKRHLLCRRRRRLYGDSDIL